MPVDAKPLFCPDVIRSHLAAFSYFTIISIAWREFGRPDETAEIRYVLGEGQAQIFASRYRMVLPTEEELAVEVRRQVVLLGRIMGGALGRGFPARRDGGFAHDGGDLSWSLTDHDVIKVDPEGKEEARRQAGFRVNDDHFFEPRLYCLPDGTKQAIKRLQLDGIPRPAGS